MKRILFSHECFWYWILVENEVKFWWKWRLYDLAIAIGSFIIIKINPLFEWGCWRKNLGRYRLIFMGDKVIVSHDCKVLCAHLINPNWEGTLHLGSDKKAYIILECGLWGRVSNPNYRQQLQVTLASSIIFKKGVWFLKLN